MTRTIRPLALAALCLAARAAAAQQPAPDGRTVAESLAAAVERTYVYPDTGRLIAARVRDAARRGAYDGLAGPAYLAEALTRDLQAVNGDVHLGVRYEPGAPAPAGGPGGGPVRRSVGGGLGGPGVPSPEEVARERRANFGVERAVRLEGNVGLLEVRGFSPFPELRRKLSDAFGLLDGVDAMILDLRRAPGGSAYAANLLASSFTGPDTVHTLRVFDRRSGRTLERWTIADVPWRRPDVPLYVLTSRGTASAAEDAAFVLKNLGRATIVGERSAGAGHNNATVPLGGGYLASISYSRVFDPRTGAEWERVGVRPDVVVDPEGALAAAHALALGRLAAAAQGPRRRELEWTREWVEAQARGAAPSAEMLRRYAGTYGERLVTVVDGRLWYQRRADRPRFALTPLSATEFAVDGMLRLRFAADGSRLDALAPDGETISSPRTGDGAR